MKTYVHALSKRKLTIALATLMFAAAHAMGELGNSAATGPASHPKPQPFIAFYTPLAVWSFTIKADGSGNFDCGPTPNQSMRFPQGTFDYDGELARAQKLKTRADVTPQTGSTFRIHIHAADDTASQLYSDDTAFLTEIAELFRAAAKSDSSRHVPSSILRRWHESPPTPDCKPWDAPVQPPPSTRPTTPQ
jgi:hypothetical protein